ncbi:MAG: ATP-binding protein [Candidatus Eisenbacteria bacterium]
MYARLFACLVSYVLLLTACGRGPQSLNPSPHAHRHALTHAIQITDRPKTLVSADLDGDGVDEEVKYNTHPSGSSYLSIARVGEDRHYALWSRNFLGSAGLGGLVEVTGDAPPELVWWEQLGGDRFRVHLSRLTVARAAVSDSTMVEYEWSTGDRLMPDGRWGGDVVLWDGLDSDGDGVDDVVAMGLNTGIQKEPREACFWDSRTGEMLARVRTGSTPTGGWAIADVDGDGADELVLGLDAPGNGNRAGDWDDGHSYVVVFEADGSVLWWRELGVYSSNAELVVDDLDGDGLKEVVTVVGGHSEQDVETFRLTVWRGDDGALLAERRFGCSVNAVETLACDEGVRVFAGSSDGYVRRLRWDGETLVVEAELDCGDAVECLRGVSLEPDPAPESLAVGTIKGRLAVLDESLSPRAVSDVGESVRRLLPTRVTVGGRPTPGLLVFGEDRAFRLHLVRRPLPRWMTFVLPLSAVVVALLLFPLTRRTALAWLRRRLLPGRSRGEASDGLLNSLTAASHGKLAATSTLRRLREQFRMLQHFEGSPPDAFRERFDQTVRDLKDVSLPGIIGVVEEAERLGLAVRHTASLRASLERIGTTLGELPRGPLSSAGATALGARLDALLPETESSLLAIRRAAELERSSDVSGELDRALGACATESRRRGATIAVESCDPISGVRVLGTPGEVSFVLENLIANAIDAVAGRDARRISVSAAVDSTHAVVTVSDTGKGIHPQDKERVFTEGFTDKPEGGHGLALSRRMLARRGGTVALVRSSPNEGAVFEARFAIVGSR